MLSPITTFTAAACRRDPALSNSEMSGQDERVQCIASSFTVATR